jgi:hypothetical protein
MMKREWQILVVIRITLWFIMLDGLNEVKRFLSMRGANPEALQDARIQSRT